MPNTPPDFLRTAGEDTEPDVFWDHPDEIREGVTREEWRNINPNPLPDDEREWLSRMNFFPTEIEQYLAGETIDWGREVMPSGIQSESNLSVSGGSPTNQYYWSIGFIDNEGLVRGDQFAAVRSRLNVNFTIADWLDIGANVQYSDRDESAVPASVSSMQLVSPFARMYNEDGTPKWYPGDYRGGPNPLEGTLGTDRDRRNTNLYGDLHMELDLPYNISGRVSFQPRYLNQRDYRFWSPETRIGGESFSGGRADRREWQEFEWMVDVQLMWDRDIGVHSFDATALFTAEEERTWFNNITNNTFEPSPVLGFHGIDFGSNPSFNVNDEKVTGNGMMARLHYSLLDRYLITGTFRRDGYSAFGSEFPKANFPSVAFAWQIAQEDFFNVDLVNELKLRLSWGKAGNREIGPYSALARMTSNQYYDGSRVHMGVTTSNLANRALRWEETESINVGLDIGILEHRINLTLDYYDMTTGNLLVNRTLPRLTGFDDVTTNIGELDNRGYEMTLRTVNVSTPDLTWSTRLNLGLNRNKIRTLFGDQGTYILQGEEFEGELPDFANAWFPGRSIHAIWDYNIEGMWQEEEAAEAAEYNLSPGDFKATDLSDSGTYEAVLDKMFIGHTEPRYRLGMRNRLSWRNFTATAFIRADLGHKLPFSDATAGHSTFDRRNTPPFPYWTPENRSNEWPRLARNESPFGGGIQLYKDASFVRLQDLSLSYQVPMEMAGRLLMHNIRFTASVRNLFTITNWDGFDPESLSPMPRTITLGINLSI